MCREEIKARHRVVRSRDQRIDLISLMAQRGVIASKVLLGRPPLLLEEKTQSLDGPQTPGDAGRKERIDKGVGMREESPAPAGRARRTSRPTSALGLMAARAAHS